MGLCWQQRVAWVWQPAFPPGSPGTTEQVPRGSQSKELGQGPLCWREGWGPQEAVSWSPGVWGLEAAEIPAGGVEPSWAPPGLDTLPSPPQCPPSPAPQASVGPLMWPVGLGKGCRVPCTLAWVCTCRLPAVCGVQGPRASPRSLEPCRAASGSGKPHRKVGRREAVFILRHKHPLQGYRSLCVSSQAIGWPRGDSSLSAPLPPPEPCPWPIGVQVGP